MLEILVPPTEITGAREKRETIGETITQSEIISTTVVVSIRTAAAVNGLASTLTSIVTLRYSDTHNTCAIPCDCEVTIG